MTRFEWPRIGIEYIATDIDQETQQAIIKTFDSHRSMSSVDLRLLAKDLVALADEIDAASPSQDELIREMVEEEIEDEETRDA